MQQLQETPWFCPVTRARARSEYNVLTRKALDVFDPEWDVVDVSERGERLVLALSPAHRLPAVEVAVAATLLRNHPGVAKRLMAWAADEARGSAGVAQALEVILDGFVIGVAVRYPDAAGPGRQAVVVRQCHVSEV